MRYSSRGLRRRGNTDKWEVTQLERSCFIARATPPGFPTRRAAFFGLKIVSFLARISC